MAKHSDTDSNGSKRDHKRRKHRKSRSPSSEKSTSSSATRHHRSHKKSSSKKASRSRSRSKDRTRRQKSRSRSSHRSPSYTKKSRQRSRSRSKEKIKTEKTSVKPGESSTKMSAVTDLTPEEQLKHKMQMALKAAAEADSQLREKGVLPAGKNIFQGKSALPTLTIQEQIIRAQAITNINAPGFEQTDFTSSRFAPLKQETTHPDLDDHDVIIFGSSAESRIVENRLMSKTPVATESIIKDQLIHPNLFADVAAKQERWVRRLFSMRQKRLNGEVMS